MPKRPSVPTSKALIGIAGVHYVAAELSRRGMVALPTVRNTAAYDIIVITQEGDRHANIQVKASSTRTSFFPMPSPEKIRAGECDHYVLVRWLEKTKQFEAFMLKGKEAKKAVLETIEWQTENIKKGTRTVLFPAIDIGSKRPEWTRWKKAWEAWML